MWINKSGFAANDMQSSFFGSTYYVKSSSDWEKERSYGIFYAHLLFTCRLHKQILAIRKLLPNKFKQSLVSASTKYRNRFIIYISAYTQKPRPKRLTTVKYEVSKSDINVPRRYRRKFCFGVLVLWRKTFQICGICYLI